MLYSLTYLEARESKHNIKDRDKVNADSNIIINADIVGKKVVIIDYRKWRICDFMVRGTSGRAGLP